MRSGVPRAALALAVLAAACDPSGPSSPPADGGDAEPGGGADPGAAPAPTPAPAPEPGAAEPRWVTVIGGLGNEYLHDLATADGDAIVALNLVGVRGDRIDELGVHRLEQPDGREAWKTFHPVGGVPLRVAPGGLAAAGGELYAAFTARCEGGQCARAGGVPVAGALLVKLSGGGDVVWARPLRGEVASNVAADGGGALVATSAGGVAVIHRFGGDGGLAWEVPAEGPVAAVALDEGAVVVAGGGSVTRLGAAGNREWRAEVPGAEDVVASSGTLYAYGGGTVVALDPGGVRRWATPVPGASGGAGARRLAAVPGGGVSVLGGAGCDAVLSRLGEGGDVRWSHRLVRGGCAGDAVEFFGHAATSDGAAVSGVLRGNAVDLGVERRDVSGPMDGFVLAVAE